MIHLDRLTYAYPGALTPALQDVTLHVSEQEFVLVTGPSGAGKSTLLRCLNGLVPHFTGGTLSGSVSVAGHDPVADGPQVLSRFVGFVFQDPEAQFVVDRVEDEIAFALENQAVPPDEMRARVEEVLGLLGLTPLRDRPLETLSSGERQRVAIAAALALRPRILVLDEPTSQLDPLSAQDVLETLVRLRDRTELTIVLAEHRLERVLPHVDRLVYLEGCGQPVLSGSPRKILGQMDLTPPLITLGKALGWKPLPLTLDEGRALARAQVASGGREVSRPHPEPPAPRHAASTSTFSEAVLQVERLSFSYGANRVLCRVSLAVEAGELVALVGPNGSGKTTLLRCIVGLLNPDQGRILLEGESVAGQDTADLCRRIGYLPQNPNDLLFADTVLEELEVTLRNLGLSDAPPVDPDELLDRLHLREVATSYPRDLSVGQRQRVALGAVTVTRPRLLLLDEPTRGMDYPAKRELVRLLRQWQGEGTGVLLVTHDVELVAQAADRVALLVGGEIVADGPPSPVLTESPMFAPQMARLFPHSGWLTVDDVLSHLRPLTSLPLCGKLSPDDNFSLAGE
jgi:energy-coupling factor transport system ATP-binding protein